MELPGLLGPPALRVARRALVDLRIAQQRLRPEPGRWLEALDIEQAGQLAVELGPVPVRRCALMA
jgi:hypothetical protein